MDGLGVLYSLRDLVALTGAKRSQVENWVRSRVLVPYIASVGTGLSREYTFEGVVVCAVAVELARYRMPSPEIAHIVTDLLALTEEVPAKGLDSRGRTGFLKNWRTFVDPQQRPRESEAMLFYTPHDRRVSVSVGGPEHVLPSAATFIGVDLTRIFRQLERATSDRWLGAKRDRMTRRPKKRNSHVE